MEPYMLIGPVLAAGTALALGAMALVGIRIWARRGGGANVEEIAEAVGRQLKNEIRDEVARALDDRQGEIDELHERLDFAERLLTRGRSSGAEDEG